MADDSIFGLLGAGGSIVASGSVSGIVMRYVWGGFTKRLDGIEKAINQLVEKQDQRHERLIERLTTVENEAKAAHRRLDELKGRRR